LTKPFVIDSVIGNSRLLATLTKNGEIHRLFWPNIDYGQHVHFTKTGLVLDGKLLWAEIEQGKHEQQYVEDNNILITRSKLNDESIELEKTDFALMNQDVVVRHLKVTNQGGDRDLSLIYHSDFQIEESPLYNTVMFDEEIDTLVYYRRDTYIGVTADQPCSRFQATGSKENLETGELDGTQVHLGSHGALRWDLGRIQSGETKELTVYLILAHNLVGLKNEVKLAKAKDYAAHYVETASYWTHFLKQGRQIQTSRPEVDRLYRRSALVFKLMSDAQHGGLVAAPEFDSAYTRCGGYSYCWGRDAAYITTAIDAAGYHDLVREFYRWAVKAQSPDGSWQHRHYMNGMLAPAWGFQADEPASLIWGMWQHYLMTKDETFLDEVWDSLRKGAEYLAGFTNEETGLPAASVDLWEERTAEHTYSCAAVASGLLAAADAADHRRQPGLAEQWRNRAGEIKASIDQHLWNEEKQSFYRGINLRVNPSHYESAKLEGKEVFTQKGIKDYTLYMKRFDEMVDASLLGVNVPFALYPSDDPRLRKTAQAVEHLLTSPKVGGIRRYEDDTYAGGNPWIICSLWLALDAISVDDDDKALKYFNWSIDHQTSTGLLPEQVNKEDGTPAWVVPLTWSHAMYVLTVLALVDKGKL
jgi:glucoamylase